MRQAVQALAEAGAIEVRRGSGKGIRVLSTDPPTEVIRRAADWRREEFAHFYEARRAMELALFALAAARVSAADLEAIEAELAREGAARVDPERWPVFGLRLLRMIFRAAASPVLEHAAIRTLLRAAPANDLFQPTDELLRWAVDRDRASVAAIRSRDPVRARSAAEARLDEWYEQLQQALDGRRTLTERSIDVSFHPCLATDPTCSTASSGTTFGSASPTARACRPALAPDRDGRRCPWCWSTCRTARATPRRCGTRRCTRTSRRTAMPVPGSTSAAPASPRGSSRTSTRRRSRPTPSR